MIAGSCLGYKHTIETRANMRAGQLGHKHSEATIAKMRATKLGRKLSMETRAKLSVAKGTAILATILERNTTVEYPSITQAALALGLHPEKIRRSLLSNKDIPGYKFTVINRKN
jgi:hypothetical protein